MIFIAGTDTEVGKTIISAIFLEALNGFYWKPVQAGIEPQTDTQLVRQLTSLPESHFLPEKYILNTPASPHYAAEKDGVVINQEILLPSGKTPLIIEGAGGLMVPLNRDLLFIDLIVQWKLPVLLVAKYYLGAINHTLLSLELLKQRDIQIAGLVYNGNWEQHAKDVIAYRNPKIPVFEIPLASNKPDSEFIRLQAEVLKSSDVFKAFFNEVN